MEKIAKDPPASGLLVTMVVNDMPAAAVGIRPGDIIVSYGDAPILDRAALQEAIAARAVADSVDLVIVRAGKEKRLCAQPGRLGVNAVPVRKGVPFEMRPPATKVRFDYALVEDEPLDFWASFTLAKAKAGFEHHVYRKRGSSLILDYEVAFDGGKAYGLNHFLVQVVLAIGGARPEAQSVRFENPIEGWVTEGKLHKEGSRRTWVSSISSSKGHERNEVKVPADLVPSYAVPTLPLFITPEPGSCLHVTPLNEGLGITTPPAGIVCAERETITVTRKRIDAWRWESHALGEHGSSTWVSASDRTPLKVFYGGPVAVRTTKDDALAGISDTLEPRTA